MENSVCEKIYLRVVKQLTKGMSVLNSSEEGENLKNGQQALIVN